MIVLRLDTQIVSAVLAKIFLEQTMKVKDLLHKSFVLVLFSATIYYGAILGSVYLKGVSGERSKKIKEGDVVKRIIEIEQKFKEIDEKKNKEIIQKE